MFDSLEKPPSCIKCSSAPFDSRFWFKPSTGSNLYVIAWICRFVATGSVGFDEDSALCSFVFAFYRSLPLFCFSNSTMFVAFIHGLYNKSSLVWFLNSLLPVLVANVTTIITKVRQSFILNRDWNIFFFTFFLFKWYKCHQRLSNINWYLSLIMAPMHSLLASVQTASTFPMAAPIMILFPYPYT